MPIRSQLDRFHLRLGSPQYLVDLCLGLCPDRFCLSSSLLLNVTYDRI
jgi:hypothetical protein